MKVGDADVVIEPRQQRFVEEYVVDLNATQAAIRAGHSAKSAQQIGSENLLKPVIQAAIAIARQKQQEAVGITPLRALTEATRLALFDARRLFSDDGRPKGIHELDDATAAAISGIKISTRKDKEGDGETTVTEYKIADKNAALEKLFKHLGMYELDNAQKTDPLQAILDRITSTNANGFAPVADDPEHQDG